LCVSSVHSLRAVFSLRGPPSNSLLVRRSAAAALLPFDKHKE